MPVLLLALRHRLKIVILEFPRLRCLFEFLSHRLRTIARNRLQDLRIGDGFKQCLGQSGVVTLARS